MPFAVHVAIRYPFGSVVSCTFDAPAGPLNGEYADDPAARSNAYCVPLHVKLINALFCVSNATDGASIGAEQVGGSLVSELDHAVAPADRTEARISAVPLAATGYAKAICA